MHNYMCDRCEDTGKIGIIFKKTCPQCNGDPLVYFSKMHPRPSKLPPAPPPPPRKPY